MTPPFSVHVPGDADGEYSLVLGVSYPFLLLGPAPGSTKLRWVDALDADFGVVYYDRPWALPFVTSDLQRRPPAPET